MSCTVDFATPVAFAIARLDYSVIDRSSSIENDRGVVQAGAFSASLVKRSATRRAMLRSRPTAG
jgi:hypothetical protein